MKVSHVLLYIFYKYVYMLITFLVIGIQIVLIIQVNTLQWKYIYHLFFPSYIPRNIHVLDYLKVLVSYYTSPHCLQKPLHVTSYISKHRNTKTY